MTFEKLGRKIARNYHFLLHFQCKILPQRYFLSEIFGNYSRDVSGIIKALHFDRKMSVDDCNLYRSSPDEKDFGNLQMTIVD